MRGRSVAAVHALEADADCLQRPSTASRRTTVHVLIRALSRTNARNRFRVCVRPNTFRLLWVLIVLLHGVCIAFFAFSSYAYWKLPSIAMGYTFDFYRITMPLRDLKAPALCFAGITLAHTFFLIRLLVYCLWHRCITFDVQWTGTSHWNLRFIKLLKPINIARYVQWRDKLTVAFVRLFGRQGLFGIESEHFELVYIMREVAETALQSAQAYAMSLTVSRGYLSHFIAIMIFINCWSTPLVLHHFAHFPPLARLICLLLDIGLDFVSTVLVPLTLVLPYFRYYDPVKHDFDSLIWYDDVLLVKTVNEFRLVMINTWPELITRVLFSISMLICLESAKSLLCPHHSKIQTQQIAVSLPKPSLTERGANVLERRDTQTQGFEANPNAFSVRLAVLIVLMHALFMAWGLIILVVYIYAASHVKLSGCALQVHPWFASKSACALMYVNCNHHRTNGKLDDLDELMLRMDELSLVHIVIRHCSDVEIPSRIQTFPHLVGMKIYNSTLSHWDSEAALTRHHHPNLVFLFMVNVNMTRIPDGLLSEEFPRQLRDIEISGTNLTSLPDVLDQRWETHGLVIIELCQFHIFPDVLARMKVSILIIGNNQIREIPAEIFTNPNSFLLLLTNNPIGSLPEKISGVVSAKYLVFDHTELAVFPFWLGDVLLGQTQVFAAGTVFCDQVRATARSAVTNSNISSTFLHAYKTGALQCDQAATITSPDYPRSLEVELDEKYANI